MSDEYGQEHKGHRPRLSGASAEKKKRKRSRPNDFQPENDVDDAKAKKKARLIPSAQRNPKAFTFNSAVKAAKALHR